MSGAPNPKPERRKRPSSRLTSDAVAVRDVVRARSGGRCEAGSVDCTALASQFHHRKLRSQGGPDTVENILHLCDRCHLWIHAHPARSWAAGWLLQSWQNPDGSPIEAALDAVRDAQHTDATETR